MSWQQSYFINYHASHDKSTQPTANKRSLMKTIIYYISLQTPIKSKKTDSLLIKFTQSPQKTGSRGHSAPPSEIVSFWTTRSLRISIALLGGGDMDIFWNYTILVHAFFTSKLVVFKCSSPTLMHCVPQAQIPWISCYMKLLIVVKNVSTKNWYLLERLSLSFGLKKNCHLFKWLGLSARRK